MPRRGADADANGFGHSNGPPGRCTWSARPVSRGAATGDGGEDKLWCEQRMLPEVLELCADDVCECVVKLFGFGIIY